MRFFIFYLKQLYDVKVIEIPGILVFERPHKCYHSLISKQHSQDLTSVLDCAVVVERVDDHVC